VELEEEPVELRLGEREDTLVLVRVLRRDHEKGVGKLVEPAVDCYLPFLHRL